LPEPEAGRIARLVRWLEAAGGKASALRFEAPSTTSRATYASERVAQGGSLLEIPLCRLLTVERARASPVGRRLAAAGVDDERVALAACLLEEQRTRSSPWRPYLDLLPRSYAHMPALFGEDDLALLRGSMCVEMIRRERARLDRGLDRLRRGVAELRSLPFDQAAWARMSVSTRAFGIEIGGARTEALVPALDLVDHRPDCGTRWGYDDGSARLVLAASREMEAGRTVWVDYGRKCNARLFVHYGFVLDHDDANRAVVPLETGVGEPAPFEVSADPMSKETRALLSFLRMRCAGARPESSPTDTGPISVANEAAALELLIVACTEALDRFETTIAEDDALLADARQPPNARTAIRVRRGEKRVLHDLANVARTALARFAASSAHRGAGGGPLSAYERSVLAR
jgi:histone-lysine N-methyltransferase SETD3